MTTEIKEKRPVGRPKGDGETRAVSFRLGDAHKKKLTRLSQSYNVSQTDMVKKMIDTIYKAKFGD
jgi:hypothetical protein|tara:strand:+ start:2363 stop:2557 length:195 start_codon:yes stop_codon:yes gene_type:complete